MKIFNVNERIDLSKNSIDELMEKEYEFYKKICNNYNIFNKSYQVCKKVNYQCRLFLSCNANCPFCIEKDSAKNYRVCNLSYLENFDESMIELHKNKIFPTVTITGGEPCLDSEKLLNLLDLIKKHNIEKYNINTNGILLTNKVLDKIKEVKMPYLNISLHSYDLNKNKELFGGISITRNKLLDIKEKIGGTYYDTTRVRFQCVLIKDAIDSLDEIKKYLDFVKELGYDNVAFRGLSKLKDKSVDENLHKYCEEHSVDIFPIMDQLKDDENFKFNCQNISDHYLYEDWVYKGIDVHFAYSDMDILEKREKEEIKNDIYYAREFVLYEDGDFCGGWNKEIKNIK